MLKFDEDHHGMETSLHKVEALSHDQAVRKGSYISRRLDGFERRPTRRPSIFRVLVTITTPTSCRFIEVNMLVVLWLPRIAASFSSPRSNIDAQPYPFSLVSS